VAGLTQNIKIFLIFLPGPQSSQTQSKVVYPQVRALLIKNQKATCHKTAFSRPVITL